MYFVPLVWPLSREDVNRKRIRLNQFNLNEPAAILKHVTHGCRLICTLERDGASVALFPITLGPFAAAPLLFRCANWLA